MAEYFAITVHPTALDADRLTVSDAMRQVLDIVDLLDKADKSLDDGSPRVVWRLHSASTNSPFRVEIEPTSADPTVSIGLKAASSVERLCQGVELLFRNEKSWWIDLPTTKLLKRVFERNLNGVGMTQFGFTGRSQVVVNHQTASRALLLLESVEIEEAAEQPDLTRTEYGSVEGEIIGTGRFYSSPSITLKDRLSGEKIVCVLTSEMAAQLGPNHNWAEVWTGRRVLAGGALHFDAYGQVRRVDLDSLSYVEGDLIDLNDVSNVDLLNGKTVGEHLNLLWGGASGGKA